MKKAARQNDADAARLPKAAKNIRDNVWCEKFGYFIDLEACSSRSYQKIVCRRCFASLVQTSLPFD